jgi:pSer/pThr/pTyr-binding forkhead associated (FHA) protein
MVQLTILSGKMAGDIQVIRHFPFLIGRSGENDLCLDEPGIWDKHLTLGFQKRQGFILETAPDALATVNGQPQKSTRLRNGDIISFGSAKIQFWLAPAPLRGLRTREMFVWMLLATVTAGQFVLIYWLNR